MKIQNISTGGMLIEGDEPLKIGTIIKLDLFIKKRKKLHRFMCRVVRIEEILINKLFEIGVAFINLSEEQKVIVKELVN
jgi:c-di-GMP-binding flagellar brake protein YcgR